MGNISRLLRRARRGEGKSNDGFSIDDIDYSFHLDFDNTASLRLHSNGLNLLGITSTKNGLLDDDHVFDNPGLLGPYYETSARNNKYCCRFVRNNNHGLLSTGIQTTNLLANASSGWVFYIFRKRDLITTSYDQPIISFAKGDTEQTRFIVGTDFASRVLNHIAIGARRLDGDPFYSGQNPYPVDNEIHIVFSLINYINSSMTLYIDGSKIFDVKGIFVSGGGHTSNTASYNGVAIGSAVGRVRATCDSHITLWKLIMGANSVPTETEIDKLFGYYAHYYDIANLLPSNHPYKHISP